MRMKRLELILQQPYGVVCKRLFDLVCAAVCPMSCVEHQGLGKEPGASMAVSRCAGLDAQSQSRDPPP